MNGMTMTELHDALKNNHEVEFVLHSQTYLIQPEERETITYLTIWQVDSGTSCITDIATASKDVISDDEVDVLLSKKCFDGRSFLDLSDQVTVTAVF